MSRAVLTLAAFFIVAGCASGSALVIGQARPAIQDFNTVTILTEMPDGAEQIAIVKASSGMGFTQQESLDYAVDELKKQAAKVGANAVVLTGRGTATDIASIPNYGPQGGTTVVSDDKEVVEGIAVYIE